jgi:hypothetical protein
MDEAEVEKVEEAMDAGIKRVDNLLSLWDQFLLGHDIHSQMIRNKY